MTTPEEPILPLHEAGELAERRKGERRVTKMITGFERRYNRGGKYKDRRTAVKASGPDIAAAMEWAKKYITGDPRWQPRSYRNAAESILAMYAVMYNLHWTSDEALPQPPRSESGTAPSATEEPHV